MATTLDTNVTIGDFIYNAEDIINSYNEALQSLGNEQLSDATKNQLAEAFARRYLFAASDDERSRLVRQIYHTLRNDIELLDNARVTVKALIREFCYEDIRNILQDIVGDRLRSVIRDDHEDWIRSLVYDTVRQISHQTPDEWQLGMMYANYARNAARSEARRAIDEARNSNNDGPDPAPDENRPF